MSKVLPMKDNLASYKIHKDMLFDLPMKVLLIGRSELSGKSTMIGNLLLRPFDNSDESGKEFYKQDFKGENIYIVNPSIHLDDKYASIIKAKGIPEGNIFTDFDEEELTQLYARLQEQYDEEVAVGKIEQKLFIFDDCAHSGDLKAKQYGILTKLAANGRHLGISMIVTAQKYSAVNTLVRENATGVILWECSGKQLDLVSEDHATMPKPKFEKMFRECTKDKHSFMVINYSNPTDARFLNSNFEPINHS
jgi:hypothetical protein